MQSHSTVAGFVSYYVFSTVLTNLIVSVPEQGFLHFPGKTIYFLDKEAFHFAF